MARWAIVRDGQRSAGQYDAMAVQYTADNAENACNAHYERPATISLVGEVEGRRVLEAGCGAGPLTGWLVDHGAAVTALDVSPVMLQLARERVGDRAAFVLADLADTLPFGPHTTFNLVVASLVLHYVKDWETPLAEFRRLLTADGAVVFSTHHPTMDWQLHCPDDYFVVKQVTETWSKGSQDFQVTFWRRPLTAMTAAIAAAGFVIERVLEPEPSAEIRDRDPEAYALLATQPQFLFFRLRPA